MGQSSDSHKCLVSTSEVPITQVPIRRSLECFFDLQTENEHSCKMHDKWIKRMFT